MLIAHPEKLIFHIHIENIKKIIDIIIIHLCTHESHKIFLYSNTTFKSNKYNVEFFQLHQSKTNNFVYIK